MARVGNAPSTRRRTVFALMLAIFTTLSVSLGAAVAQGDGGREDHGSADVTFTKWVTSAPGLASGTMAGADMTGVVGGDVGAGTFEGLVIRDNSSRPDFWLAQAHYGFNGSAHSFVADNQITEDHRTTPNTATIRGVVKEGWMKGARVTGEYTVLYPCPIGTPGNLFGGNPGVCFQGTLHLHLGN